MYLIIHLSEVSPVINSMFAYYFVDQKNNNNQLGN